MMMVILIATPTTLREKEKILNDCLLADDQLLLTTESLFCLTNINSSQSLEKAIKTIDL